MKEKGKISMIDKRTIFEIHRLRDEGLSIRRIARSLGISRRIVKKYLDNPQVSPPTRKGRAGKLDAYKEKIAELFKQDPGVSAVVVKQHLDELGYEGKITILRDYLQSIRQREKKVYIRFETAPGKQCQVDWGYFGSLTYTNTSRKLYCFAMIECYSRLLYLEFTHSQTIEAFLRTHLHAFQFFGGAPQEIVHDNLKTAVIERAGKIIRFNERYLDFLRQFHIVPVACNPGAPWEKGKIEKGGIHYIRHNFWPCRKFKGLADVNIQACQWRDKVANVRIQATTGEKPQERFMWDRMSPLYSNLDLDLRDTAPARVHTDGRVQFDGNYYSLPSWTVGKDVIVKADNEVVTVYYKDRAIATHPRSWERKKVIENQRHIQSLLKGKKKAFRSKQEEIFLSLGEGAEDFLEGLAGNGQPLERDIERLLSLKDKYGRCALIKAIEIASHHGAYGVDYIENILYQQARPVHNHPRVVLKNEELNRLRLNEVDLKEYDSLILKQRRQGHDHNGDD